MFKKKVKHLCAVCLTLIRHLGSSVKAEGIWKGHSEYPLNDEPYNSMIFEQLGRIEESGGMERNDKPPLKRDRPLLKRAKVVRSVHA